jgi:hypothetical protein
MKELESVLHSTSTSIVDESFFNIVSAPQTSTYTGMVKVGMKVQSLPVVGSKYY